MRSRKNRKKDSVWTKPVGELFPENSIWGKDLIPPDSILRKDLLPPDSVWNRDIFGRDRKSTCASCPILMLEEERQCNRYERIPDDIWDGIEVCPLYEEKFGA
ncbi:MAG: hypothetical protein V1748_05620 [Actinomycetota bacterium]